MSYACRLKSAANARRCHGNCESVCKIRSASIQTSQRDSTVRGSGTHIDVSCAGRSTGRQGFATSLSNGLCMSSSKSTQRIFPSFHLSCTRLEGSITPRRIRKTAASSLANSSAFLAVLQFDTAILTAPTPPQLVIVTNIFRVSLIALTRRFAESFTSGGYSVLDFPRKRTMFSGTTRLAAGSLADMSLTSSYHCPPSSGLRIH